MTKYCPEEHLIAAVPNNVGGHDYEIRCGEETIIAERRMSGQYEGDVDEAVQTWMQQTVRVHNLEWLLTAGLTTDGANHKQWCLEQIAEVLHIGVPEHEAGVAP